MNVSLTPELEEMVHRKVEAGMYSSASEVVREALRLLKEQDDLKQHRLEQLRQQVAIGLEQLHQGRSKPLDGRLIEGIKARGQTKLKHEQRAARR